MLFINLITFLFFFCRSVSCHCVGPHKQYNDFILKPFTDSRKFKNIILENGIDVLLIEDKTVERSGYSVGVKVGSFYDPENVFGLFHLLEHVLFLGSKKYPKPEDYDEFMAQHGGINNAFTAEERTIYFNEIGEEHLEDGLEHFSRFFIDPVFDEKMIIKEINSVDSEHLKNVPNESYRLWYTLKRYSYPPFSYFTTGNMETLARVPESKGISIPILLKKMYMKYYCGENMFFVLLSKRTIEEQEKLVSRYFSSVSKNNNGNCKRNELKNQETQEIIKEKYLGKMVTIQPLKNDKQIWLVWSFPISSNSFSKQPLQLLSYIFNSRKKNALYWYLEQNDLIIDISTIYESYSFGSIFIYQLELSKKGYLKIYQVIEIIFKYINKLKISKELIKVYKGIKELSEREFAIKNEIQEKSPLYIVSDICSKIVKYGVHNSLSAETLIEEIDEVLLGKILNMIVPQKTLFITEGYLNGEEPFAIQDKYYKVVQTVQGISKEILIKWEKGEFQSKLDNEIVVPIPKSCSPLNLKIIQELSDFTFPETLDSNLAKIWWHKPITKNHRVGIKILLKYPKRHSKRIETQVWGRIIVYLVNLLLEVDIQEFKECGILLNLEWEEDGIQIEINTFGYSDDIERLLNTVVAPAFKKVNEIDCKSLEEILEQMTESDSGFYDVGETSYLKALELIKSLQLSEGFTEWELKNYLSKIVFEKQSDSSYGHRKSLISFLVTYLKSLTNYNSEKVCNMLNNWSYKILHRQSVISYIQGNITKHKAVEMIEGFVINSNLQPLNEKYSMNKGVYIIKNSLDITLYSPILQDDNNTVLMSFQFGIPTFEELLHLMALKPLIQGYLFDNLRTKKQMGYIVLASIISICKIKSLIIGIEGNSNNSVENIEMNIYKVLHKFSLEKLVNMKDSVFESIKAALIEELYSIRNSFSLSFYQYWEDIRCFGNTSEIMEVNRAVEYIGNRMTIKSIFETFTKLVNKNRQMKANSIIKIINNKKPYDLENKYEYIYEVLRVAREHLKKNDKY